MGKYTLKNFNIKKLKDILEEMSINYIKCDIDVDIEDNSVKFVPLSNPTKKEDKYLPPPSSRKKMDLDDLAETG